MKDLTRRQCLKKISEFDQLACVLLVFGYREESAAATLLANLYRTALTEMPPVKPRAFRERPYDPGRHSTDATNYYND